MGWYLQIDGKMGCRADTDVGHGCALGPDREVAEHTASQYVEGLAGREVRVVEMDYCPAEAADHAIYMEHMEANDPQARERATRNLRRLPGRKPPHSMNAPRANPVSGALPAILPCPPFPPGRPCGIFVCRPFADRNKTPSG